MRRREFIMLLGGAAAWPVAARAEQHERIRRIGVLMALAADDPQSTSRVAAFAQGLEQLGWSIGSNVRLDLRWATGNADAARKHANELLALAPDVILANGSPAVAALQSATRSVPIVFVTVVDPVGAGFIDSLSRPGGNATGFTNYEYSMSGKWLELLMEIAPRLNRVAVLRDPSTAAGSGQLGAIKSAATSFGIELRPVDGRDPDSIERVISAFAREPNGGLIVTGTGTALIHRKLIIALTARYRLPTTYPSGLYVASGGLSSYGVDSVDQFRRAASYIDRILKGEKPADLPVQAPTKFELMINMKTAKALGLAVPATLLARADEVIE